jgi:hypothetical protein
MVIFALTDNEKYDTTKKSKGKGIFKKHTILVRFTFGKMMKLNHPCSRADEVLQPALHTKAAT